MNTVRLLYPDLSYKLQGCFFKVYNALGFGHKEVVYQRALEQELILQNIPFERETHLPIIYKGKKIAEYVPDLVIDNKIIVEIKALEFLPNKFITQLIYYLKGTDYQLGYLVNFGSPKLEILRRIWTPPIRGHSLPIRGNPIKAFTLMEILVVVALLVTLAAALLVILNPLAQINKGQDIRRKQELTQLSKVFEDFYNDKQCYPKPSEVCYNAGAETTCNICGNETASPNFSPYLPRLPCDPRSPQKNYLYQVDSTSCPTYYRIYTVLANTEDPAIAEAGCQNGCGSNYNYGVTSPNTGLEKSTITGQYACLPGGCAYCCYGPDCQTPCSTNPGDYCNGNLFIVNNLDNCTANCPCP